MAVRRDNRGACVRNFIEIFGGGQCACVSLIPQLHRDAGYDPLNRFADELKKLNRPWEAVGKQPDLLARREVSRQFIRNSWPGALTAWIMKLHDKTLGRAAILAGTATSHNRERDHTEVKGRGCKVNMKLIANPAIKWPGE
jgi:hypothetical protein